MELLDTKIYFISIFAMSDNYVFLYKAMNYKAFISSIMNTGKIIAELRKSKDWSQTDLAGKSDLSREMKAKLQSVLL